MRKNWATLAGLIAFILLLSSVIPTWTKEPVGNQVFTSLSKKKYSHTDKDGIDNIAVEWWPTWEVGISNFVDGGPPVVDPRIEIETSLNIERIWPSDPLIYSHEPGTISVLTRAGCWGKLKV